MCKSKITQVEGDRKKRYWQEQWNIETSTRLSEHPFRCELNRVVKELNLADKISLEVGCGIGQLSKATKHNYGVDVALNCGKHYEIGRFVCASSEELPFSDRVFDLVFSIYTLEHVPNVEKVLHEIRRVTVSNGYILLRPAWFCRSWTGKEWYHKPWRQCTTTEKLWKLRTKILNTFLVRSVDLLLWRLSALYSHIFGPKNVSGALRFRKLEPNFKLSNIVDADAEVWLDPFDVMLWFQRQGDRCISHPSLPDRLFCRSCTLIFQVVR